MYNLGQESWIPDYPTKPELTRQLSNYNLNAIVTPIKVDKLHQLLKQSDYDPKETNFLIAGFTQGFRLGYDGPRDINIESNNLPFRVGNNFDLWDKIMMEVEAKNYAGPYDSPAQVYPTGYAVNPVGLVEKSGKLNKTRMIIHYSYPPGSSINDFIPDSYSKVEYQDFQDAVKIGLDLVNGANQPGHTHSSDTYVDLHYSKTDAVNTLEFYQFLQMTVDFKCSKQETH